MESLHPFCLYTSVGRLNPDVEEEFIGATKSRLPLPRWAMGLPDLLSWL